MSTRIRSACSSRTEINFNPFNPYDAFIKLKGTENHMTSPNKTLQSAKSNSINLRGKSKLMINTKSHLSAMIRNVEKKGLKSQDEFSKYMNKLSNSSKRSAELLEKTKHTLIQTNKEVQAMQWQKSKEQAFLEYLVEQEQKIKYKGLEEQEEFAKFREKQMRVLQIKSFVQKTRKIKVQHQIGELLKDMPIPRQLQSSSKIKIDVSKLEFGKGEDQQQKVRPRKIIKSLINEKMRSPKSLDKPLLFGVSNIDHRRLRVHEGQGYKPPLPLDFINLGLTEEEKVQIIQRLYGRSSYRRTVVIQDNINYKELMEGLNVDLSPKSPGVDQAKQYEFGQETDNLMDPFEELQNDVGMSNLLLGLQEDSQ